MYSQKEEAEFLNFIFMKIYFWEKRGNIKRDFLKNSNSVKKNRESFMIYGSLGSIEIVIFIVFVVDMLLLPWKQGMLY